jgi:hypothetical protein
MQGSDLHRIIVSTAAYPMHPQEVTVLGMLYSTEICSPILLEDILSSDVYLNIMDNEIFPFL